jgi:DNA invertase Pin-like site-specific DNA recombinase
MTTTPATQTIAYARVSTLDQNLARQEAAFKAFGHVDRMFSDKASGKDTAGRAGLQECLDYVRSGDTLIVASMDRLARSLPDLLKIVHDLSAKGVTVRFLKEGLTFDGSAHADFLLGIFGSVAQFERALIRERQQEGIEIAKAEGKYKGRAPKLNEEQQNTVRQLKAEGVTVAEISRRFNISRQAIYRYLAD